jgi:hypothetical protein
LVYTLNPGRRAIIYGEIMIKNNSASAFTCLAAILLFIGLLIMSPSGSFLVFILAAFFAAAPAFFGIKKIRVAAIILLITSILLTAAKYPEFQNEHDIIRKRSKIIQMKPLSPPGYSYRISAIYYQQLDRLFP